MRNSIIRGIVTLSAVILTAKLGTVQFQGHSETWYNLNMSRIVVRAHENGIEGSYWIDEQGLKRFDDYVMVAADWNLHPYGSIVETSKGLGIVLDTHTAKDRELIDIATDWEKKK